jgi:coenzyme PQQ precursor peptide PqqA
VTACPKGSEQMAWKSPKIVEISLGCEINCYACAEIKA